MIMCQFLFCGQESKQRIFLPVKEILFLFPYLTFSIFSFLMFLYHSSTFSLIIPALFEEKAGILLYPRQSVHPSVCNVTPLLLDHLR